MPASIISQPVCDGQTDLILPPEDDEKETSERTAPATEVVPVVYGRRWYMLVTFGALGCLQGGLLVVWLVVADSAKVAFNWSNADLSLMSQWTYITYFTGIIPFMWIMQNKGLRVSTVLAATFTFLGAICHIITSTPPYITWLANAGQLLIGLAGPVLFCGAPLVSTAWFPPDQRSTATAIGTVLGTGGYSVVFILDPYIVPAPKRIYNGTHHDHPIVTNISEIRQAIMYLRYAECGVAALLLLIVLIYFPAKPPNAPSISASTPKLQFFKGIRQLFTRRRLNFWYLVIASGVSTGLYGIYSSLLDVNVKDIGVTQQTAGWLNFLASLGSCFSGMLFGWLADRCVGYRKLMLLVLTSLAVLCAFVVILIVGRYIPFYKYLLYIPYVAIGVLVNGSLPLYFETAIETTFPISEGVTIGVVTLGYNIVPFIFLLVLLDPSIGTMWMNWCMYGALIICVPFILLYTERYERLALDKHNVEKFNESDQ